MMETLKPCPFCGGEHMQVRYIGYEKQSAFESGYRIKCCDCGVISKACTDPAVAIAAWNHRAERSCKRLRPYYGDAPVIGAPCICSECRQELTADHRFCPNCGAKVVEE